ncbi:Bacteroides conjugation system ATPase, TraG family [Pedobacter westerhofensis]|uniref:Bacteroides conjugation system ATPase, TraG family n=1 Tax=Pedobacter westerhofensis TaxID=425512 RepID=A0A521DPJ6_9SPHI|nr:TraG family conjugative transposon ATPase [Pedobacter westerhofensis]SMO73558.1 Bacteroides conjugation system ATPase, TraG family [Pedobacter westerhofensis]
MSKPIDFSKVFPIYNLEHGCIVSMQGDLTVVFKVDHADIFTLGSAEYEAAHHTWVKALKTLPFDTVVHKQDTFIRTRHQANVDGSQTFLTLAGEKAFDGRVFLEHTCYLMITKKPDGRRAATSGYSGLMRKSIAPRQTTIPSLFADFMEKVGGFERILSDSGLVSLRQLSDDELAGTTGKTGIIESYCSLIPAGERPLLRDVHLKEEIRIGENYCQLFSLADVEDLPSLCGSRVNYDKYSTDKSKFSLGFAAHLGLLLDCNHQYNQYFFIGDPQKTIKGLEAKKLRLHSLSAYSRENAVSRDAVNDFLNEAVAEGRLPIKAHFNVMAWTSDRAELQEIRNKVSSAMASMDAVAKQETDGAAQIWWAGIPGNAADFPLNDTFDTFVEQASCFLNMESNAKSDGKGIRFGDRNSGRPVYIDLFDQPMDSGLVTNRNLFICGGSGAGKSMACNHMLRTLYDQGTHCVTIDIGGSYKGLCELVGGYYFTYTEENPIKFNPFYLAPGDSLDIEKKESLKTLLLALWKRDGDHFSRSEYVAVSGAITMYYEHLAKKPAVFPGFNSFYDFLMLEYTQVMENGKVKEKDFDLSNLLYVLNPYYKGGEFDYLLNATQNLDLLNERFIVFELDNIRSHEVLFPVVTIIIMEMFISKMRKLKGQRKILTIDEAWIAIAKTGMSHFIKYLYKTVRKFNGIAALITQEVDDLISSPIIKETVINLSDTKILLDMRKFINKFDGLQQTLGLSEKAKTLLLSVNKANEKGKTYREVFIDQGGQKLSVYRNELSAAEYLAYTTEESEKLRVMEYAEKYGSMEKGITVLAEELRRKKAPSP